MKFSLITATIDREWELRRFFDSLKIQSHCDFEVIVVDQNLDGRVLRAVEQYRSKFEIYHLSSPKGLSRARNAGLCRATGDIIAFPDDDCWYPRDLLKSVDNWFQAHPSDDGVTGRSEDGDGCESATHWSADPGYITKFSVWRRAISFSIFVRQRVAEDIKEFDEKLGVGAETPWGSGEETDFLIRALDHGFRIYFEPSLIVRHPNPVVTFDAKSRERGFKYGAGMGRVLRKNHFPVWYVGYWLVRPLAGSFLSLLRFKFRKCSYHFYIFCGRARGWFS